MNNVKWLLFAALRFGSVDAKGRSALTSLLSVLGIAFGVTALIVILSVMNGFQLGYIDTILEAGSYHLQTECSQEEMDIIRNIRGIRSVVGFTDSQTLIGGKTGRQGGAVLRSLSEDVAELDPGFISAVQTLSGVFDLSEDKVILGSELAKYLGAKPGEAIDIIAVSGDSSTDIFPENAQLTVSGIFKTGYYEIDSGFAFIGKTTGINRSLSPAVTRAGIKLDNAELDASAIAAIRERLPHLEVESWRKFNRAFFGALRVEKNMLLFLAILIFFVVTVNIYNSMRKSVFERKEEMAVLAALGARISHIRLIFVLNGLWIGLCGSLAGLLLGLLISVRINSVFTLAEDIVNAVNRFITVLFTSGNGELFTLFSPEYFYMNEIPVRIVFTEVLFIFLFGALSSTIASAWASGVILKMKPAEVIRYE